MASVHALIIYRVVASSGSETWGETASVLKHFIFFCEWEFLPEGGEGGKKTLPAHLSCIWEASV